MNLNYLSILIQTVLLVVLGAVWFGPIFGKMWSKIMGFELLSIEEQKQLEKEITPYYAVQAIATIFYCTGLNIIFNLTHGTANHFIIGLMIWGLIVLPTLATDIIWGNTKKEHWTMQFLLVAVYQLISIMLVALLSKLIMM